MQESHDQSATSTSNAPSHSLKAVRPAKDKMVRLPKDKSLKGVDRNTKGTPDGTAA